MTERKKNTYTKSQTGAVSSLKNKTYIEYNTVGGGALDGRSHRRHELQNLRAERKEQKERTQRMNEARLSHLPLWGPSEAVFFLIKRPSGQPE